MKLPNGERAFVDRRKLTEYCLNFDHDDGRHKARLFESLLGMKAELADGLMDMLRQAAIAGDAVMGKADSYGQRYYIDIETRGVSGPLIIRSAWIIRRGEDSRRLVSCYIL